MLEKTTKKSVSYFESLSQGDTLSQLLHPHCMQSCGTGPALLLLHSFPNLHGELKVTLVFHCSGFPAKGLLVPLAPDGKGLPASQAV